MIAALAGRRLRALQNPTGVNPHLSYRISQARSIAHQPAGFGIVSERIGCGYPVDCGLQGQLDASVGEKGRDAAKQGVRPFACNTLEDHIDLAGATRLEHLDLHTHGARCRLHALQRRFVSDVVRFDEHGNSNAPGTSTRSSSSRFAATSAGKKLARQLAGSGNSREVAVRIAANNTGH